MADKGLHTFVICAYKESQYLETCIESLERQTYPSNILIATSTPNDYINGLAEKHQLQVVVNDSVQKGIGYDFDFALKTGDTPYVTIAHQDDTYEETYAEQVVSAMERHSDTIIAFTDYHEEHPTGIVRTNRNLKIKRFLLFPLRFSWFQTSGFIRRRILSLGNPICCPAVTFNKKQVQVPLFANDFKSNIDWMAWERLSRNKGRFVYVNEDLMMHRVHEEATTTELIRENKRIHEDYEMYCCFWPKWISKLLIKAYAKAEENVD